MIKEGSVTVDKGYYNADGTNIIKFTSHITKTLTEAAADLSYKNDIVLTLDSEGTSSFVLNGSDKTLTGYKKTHKLDSPSVYVDPTKQYILGTEPTGINGTVQAYTTEYSVKYSLLGSPSIDSNRVFTATSSGNVVTWNIPSFTTDLTIISKQYCPESPSTSGAFPFTMSVSGSNTCFGIFQGGILSAYINESAASSMNEENVKGHWVWLLFKVTASKTYMYYIFDDNNTYTIDTIPKDTDSTWTLSATDNDNNISVFSNKTLYLGCNNYQSNSVIPDTKIDLVNTSIYVDDIEYRIVDAPDNGSVSFTKGWDYESSLNRPYQIKSNQKIPLSELIANTSNLETVGYKNSVGLVYESSSDESTPIIFKTSQREPLIIVPDIYIDNTKTNLLGTTSTSESWAEGTTPYTITEGNPGELKVWTRPNLTSATSYGVVSDSRNYSSEKGWRALDGNNSTNFVPNTSAGWWKWELPVTLKFTEGSSVITWTHRNNSETMSGTDTLQFFADEACTIPLTEAFADPSASNATVDLPVVGTISTDLIYLKINSHSGWGGAAEINFTNIKEVALASSGSISFSTGFRYINEDVGSFEIDTDATKTLEQLIFPGDSKSEQMYLNLFISDTGTTDFFLTSQQLSEAPSGYRYFEQVNIVYLDKTLSYIYGTEPQQLGEDEVLVTLNVPEDSNVLIYDEDNNTLFDNAI